MPELDDYLTPPSNGGWDYPDLRGGLDIYRWNIRMDGQNIPPVERNPLRRVSHLHGDYPLPGENPEQYLQWMIRHGIPSFVDSGLCVARGVISLFFSIADFNTDTRLERLFDTTKLSFYTRIREHLLELRYRGYSVDARVDGCPSPVPISVDFR